MSRQRRHLIEPRAIDCIPEVERHGNLLFRGLSRG